MNVNQSKIVLFPEIIHIINELILIQQQGKATVFFEMAGHVNMFSVRVYAGGWITNADPSYSDTVYIETDNDGDKHILEFKNKLFAYLKTL